ncbi:MAG: thioredoxin family protein [Lachnospira sp.]
MRNIKVLGGGCSKCETLLFNAKEAAANAGIEAEVEYITDFAVIGSYGIMSTPALIIDERIVSMGKVLKSSDIEKFLK